MKKRLLAGVLWFYACWTAWAFLAAITGLPELAGPVLGTAAAALFAGDPRGIIWKASAAMPAPTMTLATEQHRA